MKLPPSRTLIWVTFGIPLFFLFSCKSVKTGVAKELDGNISAKAIVRRHYQAQTNFKTLSGKVKVDYSDGKSSQTVNVSLRMEKDKAIWMSAPLGLVKVYITPDRVSFYNKLQNEYFDGNFAYLANLLGTELNFDNLQNLLLGQALFDLREEKYKLTLGSAYYELVPRQQLQLFEALFQIEPKNYMIASQQLSQPREHRLLEIRYTDYQKVSAWILPKKVAVSAIEGTSANNILLEYRSMEFNKPLNFPYKIPNGFKEIVLNKNGL